MNPEYPFPTTKVGVAGWSYPDWRGSFYPAERPKGFSELRYAAELFDCLEINSTFYRLPEARLAASWNRQVRDLPGFVFTAKANRELTHGQLDSASLKALCKRYVEGLQPLVETERLGCVLLQFPWYIRDGHDGRERLRILAAALQPLPLVAELRHRSFLSAGEGGALPFLESLGLDFANIDLPRSSTSPPPTCVNTGTTGYFRLHGRNRSAWFDPGAGRDNKYNYLYSLEELTSLLPAIRRLAARTQTTYVITNNHYRGQAAANAFQLIQLLGRRTPDVPESLQKEFPFLQTSAG